MCYVAEDSVTKRDIKQMEFIIRYCVDIEDAIRTFGQDEEDFLSNVQFSTAVRSQLNKVRG